MEDLRACFYLCIGEQLVVVYALFPRDIFLPDDGRFVVVRDRQVVDRRSCGAMEIQVSLVSLFILSRQPHKANEIVVDVLLIVRSKEEDGGDNGSDLDDVGVDWLTVFELKLFLSCFEERGEFFGRHGVQSCLSAWSWSPIWPVRVVVSGLADLFMAYWRRSITNQLY